jgi:predicted nucleic acid-binding protein
MPYFLDSNIIIYGLHSEQDFKKSLKSARLFESAAVISTQVISECLHISQKKFRANPAALEEILEFLLGTFKLTEIHSSTLRLAARLRHSIHVSQYDAQIIAAALEAGCTTLYTEDMQHGQVIEGRLTITNPFAELAA